MSTDQLNNDLQRCVSILGPELTASICGSVRAPGVRAWLDGVGYPSPAQTSAIHSARLAMDVFAPTAPSDEVRAWFEAQNTELSEQCPVDALRAGAHDRVVAVAGARP